jgi:hypothetical protein
VQVTRVLIPVCELCKTLGSTWCVGSWYLCENCGIGFLRGDVLISTMSDKDRQKAREQMRLILRAERDPNA